MNERKYETYQFIFDAFITFIAGKIMVSSGGASHT